MQILILIGSRVHQIGPCLEKRMADATTFTNLPNKKLPSRLDLGDRKCSGIPHLVSGKGH